MVYNYARKFEFEYVNFRSLPLCVYHINYATNALLTDTYKIVDASLQTNKHFPMVATYI